MRRKFADVRKAAADKKAAATRDDYRRTYSQNLGRTKFKPTKRRVGSGGDKVLNTMREAGGDAATMFKDLIKDPVKKGIGRFIDFFPEGNKEKFLGLQKAVVDAVGRNFEEVEAAKRDDDKFTWGGDPIAVDKGSPAYQFLLNQMEDKDAFKKAVKDDKVFYTGLEEMSGDNYEASHPGYIALLNDPSRLKDMAPIRALNYMRSITGDPSNMGFDEFETLRQEQPNVYGGLTATEIAKKLLPQYQAAADEMYGDGFIANKAREYVDVDPEIMNYRDPIRDMVAPTSTGGTPRGTFLDQREYNRMDLDDQMNIKTSDLPPTYNQVYGDPMDNILYGEPGNQPLNTMLQGIYPNYTPNPILNELEGMDEQELLDWGAQNPIFAKSLGFNPYYSNMWLD